MRSFFILFLASLFLLIETYTANAQEKHWQEAWTRYQASQDAATASAPSSDILRKRRMEVQNIYNIFGKLDETEKSRLIEKLSTDKNIKHLSKNLQWIHGIDVVNSWLHGTSTLDSKVEDISDERLPSLIWIAGWDGLILHSKDNGVHWEVQHSGTKSNLEAVDFVDERKGWIVGHNGVILRTDNAGKNWSIQYDAGENVLRAIDCIDDTHCWAGGEYSFILRTKDGGKSWRKSVDIRSIYMIDTDIRSIYMIDTEKGLAGSAHGVILRTVDGGRSWKIVHKPNLIERLRGSKGIYDLHSADGKVFWAVGLKQTILKSEDGGRTWHSQTNNVHLPEGVNKNDIRLQAVRAFVVGDRAVVAGTNGFIFATADGGKNWWPQMSMRKATYSFYALGFRDERIGWAVGNAGLVLATNSAGSSWFPVRGLEFDCVRFMGNELGVSIGPESSEGPPAPEINDFLFAGASIECRN